MLAPGHKPVARRADTSRLSTDQTVPAVRPRRALGPIDRSHGARLGKAAVGALATAALVGGMSWVAPDQAAAQKVGYNQPRLFPGNSGKKVVRLQRELTALGWTVPDTGYYGPKTEAQVKRVQRNNGWRQTGVAGFRVWHRLFTDGNKVQPVRTTTSSGRRHFTKVGSDFGQPTLRHGAENDDVVQLQRELTAHGLKVPDTGWFGPMTRTKVRTLQQRHGWKATGVAGSRVWGVLLNDGNKPKKTGRPGGNKPGSSKPRHSTKVGHDFGKPVLRFGQTNSTVAQLQRELTAHGLSVPDTGYYGPMTRGKVETLQQRHGWKATGVAGSRVWGVLLHDGNKPRKNRYDLDSRCLTGGRVICVDKTKRTLYYLENNRVVRKMDARFGCASTATRNGVFTVFRKERHWTSTLYWTPMPYSLFFSGGQAVHYSSDFKARGYAGCSHGCVNIREKKKLADVFNRVRIGDRLVVYYS